MEILDNVVEEVEPVDRSSEETGREIPKGRASMLQFAATIFLSAFLLFQVQPLIGKYILPWFGGGPAVWTACMLFFQVALLGGYTYSHLISTRVPQRLHGWIHLALLGLSLLLLPIEPDANVWKPSPEDAPTLQILLLLLWTVGLPYLLLSSTAPLVQRWFSHAYPGRSPYRLYALSNIGSLLALLSYPVVFEPALVLKNQVTMWSWVYAAFALLCGWSAVRAALSASEVRNPKEQISTSREDNPTQPPGVSTVLLWLGLAAAPSSMLVATTNQMCQEVAVVPFLWVVPLALYLATFIICFDHAGWYRRRYWGTLLALVTPVAVGVLYGSVFVNIRLQIVVYSLMLFACCMTCHGELVRSKPHPRYLTLFYMLVSAGGALGGIFVAVGAPRLFSGYWEFHISLVGCILLTLAAWQWSGAWARFFREATWAWAGVTVMLLVLIAALGAHAHIMRENELAAARNFYGILRVVDISDSFGVKHGLSHGRILHGFQFLDEERRNRPNAYFGPQSGLGLALQNHPRRRSETPGERRLRVGVVGLGIGTIAAYGQPGDYFRFYEINPEVVRLAEEHFSYISQAPSKVDIVLGDGRIQLEREVGRGESQQFDVLVMDAFSGDSVPMHLITSEAVSLYLQHLEHDGLLLFNITNRSIDLSPVVRGLANTFGLQVIKVQSETDDAQGFKAATWTVLTKNQKFLAQPVIQASVTPWSDLDREPLLWTDSFGSLWQVLKH